MPRSADREYGKHLKLLLIQTVRETKRHAQHIQHILSKLNLRQCKDCCLTARRSFLVTWQTCRNRWSNRFCFTKHSLKKTNCSPCTVCKYCKYRVSRNVPDRNQKKGRGWGGASNCFKFFFFFLQIISNWKFCVVEQKPLPTCYLPLLPTQLDLLLSK